MTAPSAVFVCFGDLNECQNCGGSAHPRRDAEHNDGCPVTVA